MGTVVDSSWLIRAERSLSRDASLTLVLPSNPFVSTVTIAELYIGVELADEANRTFRKQFVETVTGSATILPFGLNEALQYARLAALLRRAGTPIGERDLMIAATALANGHSLVTLNAAEFAHVPGLTILPDPLPRSPNL